MITEVFHGCIICLLRKDGTAMKDLPAVLRDDASRLAGGSCAIMLQDLPAGLAQ